MTPLFAAALLFAQDPTTLPPPARGIELSDRRGERIPLDLAFTDSDGQPFKLAALFNQVSPAGKPRPVVVMMMYYRCPVLCPAVLEKFTDALNQVDFTVGEHFDVAIVSFDPRDRSPDAAVQKEAQLMAYARPTTDSVRRGWRFLVSDDAGVPRALADSLGFPYKFLPDSDQFSHGSAVFILTPDGRVSRCLNGLSYPPADVRLALIEASDGRIGSFFDSWMARCFMWDPSKSTYTLAAMRLMRVGGALSALLVGTLVGFMVRHELRRRRRSAAAKELDQMERTLTGALPGLIGHAR